MTGIANPQKRNLWICLGFGLLGLVMIIAPSAAGIDMMNGGGALIMIGLLFFLTSLPVAVMFYRRARLLDDLLQGRDVLAHWRYEPTLWARYAGEEEIRDTEHKKTLFCIISAFAFVIGGLFFVLDPEGGGPVTFLACIALIIVIGFAAWISIRVKARRNRTQMAEVYISANGLYLNNALHSWQHIGSQLESVRLVSGQVPIIEFTYSFFTKNGQQHETVNVPVPYEEMAAAAQIVDYFRQAHQ